MTISGFKSEGSSRCSRSSQHALSPTVTTWMATQGVALATAIATAFLLAGCATGIRPTAKLIDPQTLKMEQSVVADGQAQWPSSQWWKSFGDPQLDRLMDEAVKGSPNLRVAQARLEKANALAGLAQTATSPSLIAQGATERERFTENYIYPPPLGGSWYTTNTYGLNFKWDLDFFGRNRTAIEAARSQVQVAQAESSAATLSLTTAVARAYFQLARLYALHDVTQAAIGQRQDILQLTQQRVSAGLDTNVELRQSEAALPSARVDLRQIEENIALVRNQLAALLGEGPDRGASLDRPQLAQVALPAIPAVLPANLLGRRPDLVAARWRVEAASHDIDNAKAQFYPNINLMAAPTFISLGTSKIFSASSLDLSAGPAISLPLFQGSLRADLRSKDADYDVAVEQYNQSVIDAVKDVADQVASLRSVSDQQADEQQARMRTEQAYELAVQRYKAGIGNYLTVLIAQNAVLAQQRADSELRSRVLDVNVNLIRALGGGFDVQPLSANRS